jgi:predicted metal-dependent HD superfamily phosphohydrolase
VKNELFRRWRELAGAGMDDVGRSLIAAYSEPQRRYHGLGHVNWLLEEVRRRAALIQDPVLVGFAIWFHDAVYDPRRTDNEDLSAEWAARALPPGPRTEQVADLIRRTKSHAQGDAGGDAAVFLDMDIAILGAARDVYSAYAADIRAEYGHIPDALFAAGRGAFLQAQLSRGRIFRTDTYEMELGQRARANLAWEVDQLRRTGSNGA